MNDNSLSKVEKKILKLCSESWFKNPAGISACDLENDLSLTNNEIMSIMEELNRKGYGNIKSNVELFPISIDKVNRKLDISENGIITHIFFPSSEVLRKEFYKSKLSKEEIPEYKKRLHLGGIQIGLILFKEEVLKKYFDHPERYTIDDTLAGGTLYTNCKYEEQEYINIRYGKKSINNGSTAITVILNDLSEMSANEQKYWSSNEITQYSLDKNDENFKIFWNRNFNGDCVEYPNLPENITKLIKSINSEFKAKPLYRNTENIHLVSPVLNTRKAYCDACSELYKLIGPDNIDQDVLKTYLKQMLKFTEMDFKHKKTERSLSSIQLFKLLENSIVKNNNLTKHIEIVKELRVEADHKIISNIYDTSNYTSDFNTLCKDLIAHLEYFYQNLKLYNLK